MNTINYVIKVTQAQVFAASTKIWQMRLVEQLAMQQRDTFVGVTMDNIVRVLYYPWRYVQRYAYPVRYFVENSRDAD